LINKYNQVRIRDFCQKHMFNGKLYFTILYITIIYKLTIRAKIGNSVAIYLYIIIIIIMFAYISIGQRFGSIWGRGEENMFQKGPLDGT